MVLHTIDIAIIVAFLAVSLYIGLKFRGEASKNLTSFFLGGRNMPWYIAGISMVATTFAADTPLWVTEKISQHGISGNWLWWNMLIGGMLTTFFFAKLWRKAGIVTELEFLEMRYSGKAASFLRGFKSIYMGLFINAVIIGWVNSAMGKILTVFFGIEGHTVILVLAGMMLFVAFYSSLSGLIGVAITDTVQFALAMGGCIALAVIVVNLPEVGGIVGLKEKLPAWRLDFMPSIGGEGNGVGTYSISIGAFLTFALLQWYMSWYPGAEPGGGGYIAQRIMSTKNERHAILSSLFFQIAHYCLRPWPWIIVGLCALVLYPDLSAEESGKGFVMAMRDHLPVGLKGILVVAFLGAYMSTISTQLNWGSSYITNDLYSRFIKPSDKFSSEEEAQKDYVSKGRWFTLIIMVFSILVTTQISSIDSAAQFLIACGAGLGLVVILRWYWWRINAWSEITATIVPFIVYAITKFVLELDPTLGYNITVGVTTVAWLVITFTTQPESKETLENFYKKVSPGGWWEKVRVDANLPKSDVNMKRLTFLWLNTLTLAYAVLFFIGKLILQEWQEVMILGSIMLITSFILYRALGKDNVL